MFIKKKEPGRPVKHPAWLSVPLGRDPDSYRDPGKTGGVVLIYG